MKTVPGDICQIFYDIGEGIREEDSYRIQITQFTANRHDNQTQTIDFLLPLQNIKTFRIDPGTGRGVWKIKNISTQAKIAGIVIFSHFWTPEEIVKDFQPLHSIDTFAVRDKILFLNASDSDPYFQYMADFSVYYNKLLQRVLYFRILLYCLLVGTLIFFLINILKKPALSFNSNVFCFILIIILAIIFCRNLIYSPMSFDERCFIWEGWNVLHHEVPYKDFYENKPLVIFFANAFGILCSGLNLVALKVIPFIPVLFANIFLFFTLRRRHVPHFYTCLLIVNCLYLISLDRFHDGTMNDTETYGLAFTMIAFSLLNWRTENVTLAKFTRFIGGIFVGLALNSKEPFLLVVLPMLAINYLYEYSTAIKLRNINLIMVLSGIISVSICIFSYLLINNAFIPYIMTLKKSMLYAKSFARTMGVFHSESILDSLKFDISKLLSGYSYGKYFIGLIPFYISFLWRWKFSLFTILNCLAILLGFYAVSIGHCFWSHYYLIGIFTFLQPAIYGAIYFNDFIRNIPNMWEKTFVYATIVLALFISIYGGLKKIHLQLSKYELTAPASLKNAVEMYSAEKDYILLMMNPQYYSILNRRHSFRYGTMLDELLSLYDGKNDKEKAINAINEIGNKLPKIIYIEKTCFLPRQQKHLNLIIYPLIKKYGYTKFDDDVFVLNYHTNL
jgi:hypothetical protein